MQEVEDLKEILTATQDLGVAWQNLLVAMSAENSRLVEENKNLRAGYEKLSAENKNLRNEINNLSEKFEQLHKNLRDKIFGAEELIKKDKDLDTSLRGEILKEFKELDIEGRKNFQRRVENHLENIRKCVEGTASVEKSKENSTVTEGLGTEEKPVKKKNPYGENN